MAHLPEEIIYDTENIVIVDRQRLEQLKRRALLNKRTRIRLCTHPDIKASVHEMLIFHARGNYIPPHKHNNKPESFHVIEGATTIILFDDAGQITHVIPMGVYNSRHTFYYRVPEGIYHSHLVMSDVFIYHETTKGPFDPADTILAPWAPEESDEQAARDYMKELAGRIEQEDWIHT